MRQITSVWIAAGTCLALYLFRLLGFSMIHPAMQLVYNLMLYCLLAYSLYWYRKQQCTWLHPLLHVFLHIALFAFIVFDHWLAIPLFLVFPLAGRPQWNLVWKILCSITYGIALFWLGLALLVGNVMTKTSEVYRLASPKENRFLLVEEHNQGAAGVNYVLVVVDTYFAFFQHQERYLFDDGKISYASWRWVDGHTLEADGEILRVK